MTKVVNEFNIELPVVLSNDEAAKLADTYLWRAWIERESYELKLSMKYVYLDPGDVITITIDGNAYTMRVIQANIELPGIVTIKAVAHETTVYQSSAVGAATASVTQTVYVPGDTIFRAIDAPSLRDADAASPGYYIAACGASTTWRGAVIFKSTDGGYTYNQMQALVAPAVIGKTTDALGAHSSNHWDTVNTVNVSVTCGTLASDTRLNVLGGTNAILIDDEVVQFQTATLEGDGTYTLSNLLRGRLGTEWATTAHASGGTAVLLQNDGSISRVDMPATLLNADQYFKPVTIGRTVQETTAVTSSVTGVNMKPWSMAYLKMDLNASANARIRWHRRSRYIAQAFWTPTLGEDSEKYEVDVYNSTVLLRTMSTAVPSVEYTVANYASDIASAAGSLPSTLRTEVFQMSAVVGRGYPASTTLE